MQYKFRAKDLKTGEGVEGDLVHVERLVRGRFLKLVPMIVHLCAQGGMIYVTGRHYIDEDTIVLIRDNNKGEE